MRRRLLSVVSLAAVLALSGVASADDPGSTKGNASSGSSSSKQGSSAKKKNSSGSDRDKHASDQKELQEKAAKNDAARAAETAKRDSEQAIMRNLR